LEFISITKGGIDNIEIPDEYLKLTIQGLRNNLEYASFATKDVDRFNKKSIPPFVIEINSRPSFFAVSALTCGLHIVIYF
jgi:hypothetical protein